MRPKGEISAACQPSAETDLNIKLARRVGQLNFFDFLASVNLRDDVENAANPDLVPQQSWELDLESVRKLGAYGTATLRLYGLLIDDIIDYIPIGATGESPGNLDQATVYGSNREARSISIRSALRERVSTCTLSGRIVRWTIRSPESSVRSATASRSGAASL